MVRKNAILLPVRISISNIHPDETMLAASDLVSHRTGVNAMANVFAFGRFLLSLVIVLGCFPSAVKAEEGAVATVGRDVCDLPEKTLTGRFHLPLHDDGNRALEYRRIGKTKIVLLLVLGVGNKTCGTILSVLQLPRYQSGEAIYFECYPRDSHSEDRTPLVGLASNDGGRRRLVVARLAWQVDLISNRFVPYTKRLAICDTRGYAENY